MDDDWTRSVLRHQYAVGVKVGPCHENSSTGSTSTSHIILDSCHAGARRRYKALFLVLQVLPFFSQYNDDLPRSRRNALRRNNRNASNIAQTAHLGISSTYDAHLWCPSRAPLGTWPPSRSDAVSELPPSIPVAHERNTYQRQGLHRQTTSTCAVTKSIITEAVQPYHPRRLRREGAEYPMNLDHPRKRVRFHPFLPVRRLGSGLRRIPSGDFGIWGDATPNGHVWRGRQQDPVAMGRVLRASFSDSALLQHSAVGTTKSEIRVINSRP